MAGMHFSARPTWRAQWITMLWTGGWFAVGIWLLLKFADGYPRLAGYGVLIAAVVYVLVILYRHYAWRFVIDDETIESRRGIIGRTVKSIRIEDLRNINVHQTIIERLLGVGAVEFSTAAGGGIEVVFAGIQDPMHVKRDVQRLQDALDRPGRSA